MPSALTLHCFVSRERYDDAEQAFGDDEIAAENRIPLGRLGFMQTGNNLLPQTVSPKRSAENGTT